jgi:hypothetical protein
MTISSLVIALLCFVSLLSLGIASLIIRALRPATQDANAVYTPSTPDSILDPHINLESRATSRAQLNTGPDAQRINPYQPHTAATATHSARKRQHNTTTTV